MAAVDAALSTVVAFTGGIALHFHQRGLQHLMGEADRFAVSAYR